MNNIDYHGTSLEDYDEIDLLLQGEPDDQDALLTFILMLPALPLLTLEMLIIKSELIRAIQTATQL